jgi:hypothetical protein
MATMGDLKFTTAESFVQSQRKIKMTPQEIFELKCRWINDAFEVTIHSDRFEKAKDWCKENCEKWQWEFERWVGPYSHMFQFENEVDAKDFENYMNGE